MKNQQTKRTPDQKAKLKRWWKTVCLGTNSKLANPTNPNTERKTMKITKKTTTLDPTLADRIKIIADNGGGATLQILSADHESAIYQHAYSDMSSLVVDVVGWFEIAYCGDWEGNQIADYGVLDPTNDEIANGGYRVLTLDDVLSAGEDCWKNVVNIKDALTACGHFFKGK